jgi:hypothetical protein
VQHGGNNSTDDEVGSTTPVYVPATYFSVKGKTYSNLHALLATAIVQVKDKDGNLYESRTLLDNNVNKQHCYARNNKTHVTMVFALLLKNSWVRERVEFGRKHASLYRGR